MCARCATRAVNIAAVDANQQSAAYHVMRFGLADETLRSGGVEDRDANVIRQGSTPVGS